MVCELCGKPEMIYRAVIEDVEMRVCEQCASFGKIVGKLQFDSPKATKKKKQAPTQQKPEIEEMIREDFAQVIKQAREKRKLSQKEFSQIIAEKESVVHNLETGNVKPSLVLARKMQRILHIRLIEKYEVESQRDTSEPKKKTASAFTLGDFIKVKKRKK